MTTLNFMPPPDSESSEYDNEQDSNSDKEVEIKPNQQLFKKNDNIQVPN